MRFNVIFCGVDVLDNLRQNTPKEPNGGRLI